LPICSTGNVRPANHINTFPTTTAELPVRIPLEDNPIDEMLRVTNGKWTLTVVLRLRESPRRFSELRREIGNVSQKGLTATLRALERDGLVSRTSYATIPPRVDYELTELGREALRVFEAWEAFARKYAAEVIASRQRFDAAARAASTGFDPMRRAMR
jgi:DNA-binding HxlR family transcriptional regulator